MKLLTRQELANVLQVSLRTIDKLKADGMPSIKITSTTVRFELGAVLDWLKNR